jgi:hypothetical protein
MNATAKSAFALLVVAIFLSDPVGLCAGSVNTAPPSAHPCCPKDEPANPGGCAKSGCVCASVESSKLIVPAKEHQGQSVAIPDDEVVLLPHATFSESQKPERISIVRECRFLIVCQLLI